MSWFFTKNNNVCMKSVKTLYLVNFFISLQFTLRLKISLNFIQLVDQLWVINLSMEPEVWSYTTSNKYFLVSLNFCRVGGNEQFEMMRDQIFAYDSSITAPLSKIPIWPYTLDYRQRMFFLLLLMSCLLASVNIGL